MQPFPFLALCISCAVLAGCGEPDVARQAALQRVRTAYARALDYQPTVEITGEIKARVQSELSFRTGGQVTERRVDVGAQVHKGDVLARIEDTEQRADVEIARAKLQSANATLLQKKLTYDRYAALLETRAIAQATFDQAKEELTTAQGSVDTAQANLSTAEDALSFTELKADADGLITARDIEVGQVISAAQAAFTLAHDGPRDAAFDVFEAFFLKGAPAADITVAQIGSLETARATIREISPVIDTSAGTIRVKATLPENAQWSLGTAVVGTFRAAPRHGVVVPWSAMASLDGTPAVWVVEPPGNTVSLHKVTVETYRTNDFLVASGLTPQDRIVIEGGQFLVEGRAVAWGED